MKLPTKLITFMVLGVGGTCTAFSQSGRSIGDVTVYLLQDQQLESHYTACIQAGVSEKKGYVPGFSLMARFEKAVSSTIEVNGRVVQTMPNSAETSHGENYIKDGDTFRITLTVGSPVHVVYLLAGGEKSMGIVELRTVNCPSTTKKK